MHLKTEFFNKKILLIILTFFLIWLIPIFIGSSDTLIGFHSNKDYLPDPTGRFTLHTIKSRYIFINIPISWKNSYRGRITISNRFTFGRFYNPSYITGGLVKRSHCLSSKTYISYRSPDKAENINECFGFGIIEKTNAPPIIN